MASSSRWRRLRRSCSSRLGYRATPVCGGAAPTGTGALLAKWAPRAEINTRLRLIWLLAQLAHESAFVPRAENLNYSAARLREVWPSRFPSIAAANAMARKPEALANLVYGGRMGNTQPGDGWRYRGRGWVQLTGRANYARYGFADAPDDLLTPEGAAAAAFLYWLDPSARAAKSPYQNCNQAADADDAEGLTRMINGALVGLADRIKKADQLKALWPA